MLGGSPFVLDRVLAVWRTLEENPVVNGYNEGAGLVAAEAARAEVARLIGCATDNLLITGGTTRAMNIVAGSVRLARGDAVLTTDQEHHGGIAGWTWRARRDGVRIDRVPVPPEENDVAAILARITAAIRSETRVISVSHVLFSTGLRMPLTEICALARSRGLLSVIDGAQAVGMIPVDVGAIGCHAYAASGHKWLLGPKGTGFLYLSPEISDALDALPIAAGRMPGSDSTGIVNIGGLRGLGAAVGYVGALGQERIEAHPARSRYAAKKCRFWTSSSGTTAIFIATTAPSRPRCGLTRSC